MTSWSQSSISTSPRIHSYHHNDQSTWPNTVGQIRSSTRHNLTSKVLDNAFLLSLHFNNTTWRYLIREVMWSSTPSNSFFSFPRPHSHRHISVCLTVNYPIHDLLIKPNELRPYVIQSLI